MFSSVFVKIILCYTILGDNMKEIIIASKNQGKIREYKQLLEPFGYQVSSLIDYPDFPEIPETGTTFAENAMIKAKAVAMRFSVDCLADDSGLEVMALNGNPGVHSQRYSITGTEADNNQKLLHDLVGHSKRIAQYVCSIVYYNVNTGFTSFEDTVSGIIIDTPRGHNGFGYDPYFYLPEFGVTMAEVNPDFKNKISHRGKALNQLLHWLARENR